jgi:hypothetical protein
MICRSSRKRTFTGSAARAELARAVSLCRSAIKTSESILRPSNGCSVERSMSIAMRSRSCLPKRSRIESSRKQQRRNSHRPDTQLVPTQLGRLEGMEALVDLAVRRAEAGDEALALQREFNALIQE